MITNEAISGNEGTDPGGLIPYESLSSFSTDNVEGKTYYTVRGNKHI
jgi:hypothetical protein